MIPNLRKLVKDVNDGIEHAKERKRKVFYDQFFDTYGPFMVYGNHLTLSLLSKYGQENLESYLYNEFLKNDSRFFYKFYQIRETIKFSKNFLDKINSIDNDFIFEKIKYIYENFSKDEAFYRLRAFFSVCVSVSKKQEIFKKYLSDFPLNGGKLSFLLWMESVDLANSFGEKVLEDFTYENYPYFLNNDIEIDYRAYSIPINGRKIYENLVERIHGNHQYQELIRVKLIKDYYLHSQGNVMASVLDFINSENLANVLPELLEIGLKEKKNYHSINFLIQSLYRMEKFSTYEDLFLKYIPDYIKDRNFDFFEILFKINSNSLNLLNQKTLDQIASVSEQDIKDIILNGASSRGYSLYRLEKLVSPNLWNDFRENHKVFFEDKLKEAYLVDYYAPDMFFGEYRKGFDRDYGFYEKIFSNAELKKIKSEMMHTRLLLKKRVDDVDLESIDLSVINKEQVLELVKKQILSSFDSFMNLDDCYIQYFTKHSDTEQKKIFLEDLLNIFNSKKMFDQDPVAAGQSVGNILRIFDILLSSIVGNAVAPIELNIDKSKFNKIAEYILNPEFEYGIDLPANLTLTLDRDFLFYGKSMSLRDFLYKEILNKKQKAKLFLKFKFLEYKNTEKISQNLKYTKSDKVNLEGEFVIRHRKLIENTRDIGSSYWEKVFTIFNFDIDKNFFDSILDLLFEDKLNQNLRQLDVSKTGLEGLNQLVEVLRDFRKKILSESVTAKDLENPYLFEYFRKFLRIDKSNYGSKTKEEIVRLVDLINKKERTNPSSLELKVVYKEKDLFIKTLEENKDYKYSKEFLEKFNYILGNLKAVKAITESHPKPITYLLTGLSKEISNLIEKLQTELRLVRGDDKKKKIQSQIDSLKGLIFIERKESPNKNEPKTVIRNLKKVRENFIFLSQFKDLESTLIKLVFTWLFVDNKNLQDLDLSNINTETPGQNDIAKILDLVEHVVNQEVFSKYFKDKESGKIFSKLCYVNVLEKEFNKMTKRMDVVGKTKMTIVPSKKLFLEFSGYMADACWQKNFGLISDTHPNIVALTFIQNKESKDERTVGTCLLIETKTKFWGRPVLLIRGLNPIENFINSTEDKSFYEAITNYVREVAYKTGRKPAIVIDETRGRAASNRQKVFDYLVKRKSKLRKCPVDVRGSMFNDYDVGEYSYFL